MSVHVTWVTDEQSFSALASDWETLVSRSGRSAVFLGWSWLSLWWGVYGTGRRLAMLTVRDEDGRLVGALPCCISTQLAFRCLPVRVLHFIGDGESPTSDHLDLLADLDRADEVATEVARSLANRPRYWDIARFNAVRDDGTLSLRVAPLLTRGSSHFAATMPHSECPYLPLPPDVSSFWHSLSYSTRKMLRRSRHRLEREFQVREERIERPDQLEGAFAVLQQLHTARKDRKGLTGKFATPGYRVFHKALAAALLPRGELELSCLRLNGAPAAVHYGFRYRGVLHSYQTGFDPEKGAYSPMKVLDTYVIERAIAQGLSEIDLLRGSDPYKMKLTDVVRPQLTLLLESEAARGRLHRILRRLRSMLRGMPFREILTAAPRTRLLRRISNRTA